MPSKFNKVKAIKKIIYKKKIKINFVISIIFLLFWIDEGIDIKIFVK